MAGFIGGRLGIDGEAEFRAAINNTIESMKTLGTEMKAVTSQFDKNDSSTDALTAKNKVLNKEVETQKSLLDELQKGLKIATDKYGENDRITQSWQRSVNEATAKLNNMERQVKDNNSAIANGEKPSKDTGNEIKNFGEQADKAGKKAISMGDIIKANLISDAIVGGIKSLAGAITSVTNKISESVTKTIEYASNISDTAQKTGVGTDELQKYAYAAKMSGMEMDTLQGAMVKSQKSFAEASTGNKSLAETYNKLGLDINNIGNSQDAFSQTLNALADMTDETQRNAIANDIFGKSYAELAPLLNEGSAGIEALKSKASELGVVMSKDAVNSGEALGDTLDTLKASVGGAANNIMSTMMPAISNLAKVGSGYISDFSKKIQAANGDFGKIGQAVGSTINQILSDLVKNLPNFITAAGSIVQSLFDGLMQNLPMIIDAALQLINMLITGLVNNLPKIIDAALQLMTALITGIIQNLPMLIQAALDIIIKLADGITQSLPELIPAVIEALLTIVNTLIDNLDKLIDAAIKIILALADGLLDALPKLIQKLPEIIIKIVQKLTDPEMINKIIGAGVQLFMSLIENLPQIIIELVKAIPDIIKGIVEGFGSFASTMGEIGLNLIKGIWNGIKDAGAWLWDKISGFFGGVVDRIKDFFGIHSPSTLMENDVGVNLALGVGNGFTKRMKSVSESMQKAIPSSFDTSVNVNGRLNTAYSSAAYAQGGNNYTSSSGAADIVNMVVARIRQFNIVIDGEVLGRFTDERVGKVMNAV